MVYMHKFLSYDSQSTTPHHTPSIATVRDAHESDSLNHKVSKNYVLLMRDPLILAAGCRLQVAGCGSPITSAALQTESAK